MTIGELESALCAGLTALFDFETELMPDGSIALQTPFVCNDGTTPYIFVAEQDGGGYVLSDGCEMLGGLSQRTGCQELSPKQHYVLDRICRETPGLEKNRGELTMRCEHPDELADAVLRLGQAMLRVSDLWFLGDIVTAQIERATAVEEMTA